jgi:hypothetical protein
VRFLSADAKADILAVSPIRPSDRLQELQAFQGWMDIVRESLRPHPYVVRAQVITQTTFRSYICPNPAFEFSQKSHLVAQAQRNVPAI